MALKGNVLPFERGTIWNDGNTANTGANNSLPGTQWHSKDSDRPVGKRHNLNIDETLVVMRNQTSGAIGLRNSATTGGPASRGYVMRTAASSDGAIGVGTGLAAQTAKGLLLDDSYNTNTGRIPVGCDAYFVVEGLARAVLWSGGPGTGTANVTRLYFATGGTARALWATGAGDRAFGITKETFTNTAVYRSILVGVGSRYLNP